MTIVLDFLETILLDAFILVASVPMYVWSVRLSGRGVAAARRAQLAARIMERE